MFWIPVEYTRCSHCETSVDLSVLNLSTKLGPNIAICQKCGRNVASGRIEWMQMSTYHKVWFIGISVLYAVVAYADGGLSLRSGLNLLKTGSFPREWGFAEPVFWLGGIIATLLVIFIQIYRVLASCNRTKAPELVLGRTFLSFDFSGQVKALVIISSFMAVAWAITRFPPYRQPQTSDLLIMLASILVGGIVIYRAAAETDEPLNETVAAERRNSAKLFEVLTADLDPTNPLRWVYLLEGTPHAGAISVIRNQLTSMGFAVQIKRVGHDSESVQFEISESQQHVAETFALRFNEVDRVSKLFSLQMSDCVASNG